MSIADLIARLEALDKAATPGPWIPVSDRSPYAVVMDRLRGPDGYLILESDCAADCPGCTGAFADEHDAALVATLRNELPRLLRLLRAGSGRMLEALERCEDYMDLRADADLAPGGEAMQPNREMVHLQEIRAALREWDEAARG